MKSYCRRLDIKLILPTEMSKRKQKLQGNWKDWSQIKNFIENSLVTKLKNDQKNLRILSEGDLQSCVYYHLRRYIKKTPNWHVLNKLYMGQKEDAKKVPDIAIVYLRYDGETPYPYFLIELKETIAPLRPKSVEGYNDDIKKLRDLIDNNGKIKRGYLILAVLPEHYRKGTSKTPLGHPTTAIEKEIRKNKYTSKIKPIILNKMYNKHGYVLPSFQKKHGLLRKYRE